MACFGTLYGSRRSWDLLIILYYYGPGLRMPAHMAVTICHPSSARPAHQFLAALPGLLGIMCSIMAGFCRRQGQYLGSAVQVDGRARGSTSTLAVPYLYSRGAEASDYSISTEIQYEYKYEFARLRVRYDCTSTSTVAVQYAAAGKYSGVSIVHGDMRIYGHIQRTHPSCCSPRPPRGHRARRVDEARFRCSRYQDG